MKLYPLRTRIASFGAAALLVLFSLWSGVRAARSDDDDREVSGVVTAVAPAVDPDTLTLRTSSGDLQVTVTAETEFELDDDEPDDDGDDEGDGDDGGDDDEEGDDDDDDGDGEEDDEDDDEGEIRTDLALLVGRFVTIELEGDTLVAEKIEVETQFEVSGRVTAVSAPAAPATVTIKPAFDPAVTLTITVDTDLEVDDAELVDLTSLVGLYVEAEYDPATLAASEIEAESETDLSRGVVKSVDSESGAVVLSNGRRSVRFATRGYTDVDLDFQDSSVSDLRRGTRVVVEFKRGSGGVRVARQIDGHVSRTRSAAGTVSAVSVSSQTLLVRPARAGASPILVKLNAGTSLRLNGRRAALSAVPVGASVSLRGVSHDGLVVARNVTVRAR